MTNRETALYVELKKMIHYAACLENECERLGGTIKNPKNMTLENARTVLHKADGQAA